MGITRLLGSIAIDGTGPQTGQSARVYLAPTSFIRILTDIQAGTSISYRKQLMRIPGLRLGAACCNLVDRPPRIPQTPISVDCLPSAAVQFHLELESPGSLTRKLAKTSLTRFPRVPYFPLWLRIPKKHGTRRFSPRLQQLPQTQRFWSCSIPLSIS
jgi:hypothetical protein